MAVRVDELWENDFARAADTAFQIPLPLGPAWKAKKFLVIVHNSIFQTAPDPAAACIFELRYFGGHIYKLVQ